MRAASKQATSDFSEWMSMFSEGIVVMLKVYADESSTPGERGKPGGPKFMALAGYISTQENWLAFEPRWRKVLARYKVTHFHLREFSSKDFCAVPGNPYDGWSAEKRDDFFYDQAMAASEGLIPSGSWYSLEKRNESKLTEAAIKRLFELFFTSTRTTLDSRWPGYDGKVLFVFDKTNNKAWRDAAFDAQASFANTDARFDAGLAFENDEDAMHIGLQAADFLAGIYRQAAEAKSNTGEPQKRRVIDHILARHLPQPGVEWNYSQLDPLGFKIIIDAFREDEKRQRRIWQAQGQPNKKYYPLEHFPPERRRYR